MKFNVNPISRILAYFEEFYIEYFNNILPNSLYIDINTKQKRDSNYPCGYFYPRHDKIEIFVKNCHTRDNVFLGLCHEMIHANQKARGDFDFDPNQKLFLWKNQEYDKKECLRMYPNLPWEQEAYENQRPLAEKAIYWLANQNDDRIYHFKDMIV